MGKPEDVAASIFISLFVICVLILLFGVWLLFLFVGIPCLLALWAFFRLLINTLRAYWMRDNRSWLKNQFEECITIHAKESKIQDYGNIIKMSVMRHSSYVDPLGGLLGRNRLGRQKWIACITLPIIRSALPFGIALSNALFGLYSAFTHVDD